MNPCDDKNFVDTVEKTGRTRRLYLREYGPRPSWLSRLCGRFMTAIDVYVVGDCGGDLRQPAPRDDSGDRSQKE